MAKLPVLVFCNNHAPAPSHVSDDHNHAPSAAVGSTNHGRTCPWSNIVTSSITSSAMAHEFGHGAILHTDIYVCRIVPWTSLLSMIFHSSANGPTYLNPHNDQEREPPWCMYLPMNIRHCLRLCPSPRFIPSSWLNGLGVGVGAGAGAAGSQSRRHSVGPSWLNAG